MTPRHYSEEIQELMTTLESVKQIVHNVGKPPEHIIFDDVELRNFLKVSKRTPAYWREKGEITYSKLGGKIYYRLSDVLAFIKKYEVTAIKPSL
jgi:hypothetical protein